MAVPFEPASLPEDRKRHPREVPPADARIAHALEYIAARMGEVEGHLAKIADGIGGDSQLAPAITALGRVLAQRLPLNDPKDR